MLESILAIILIGQFGQDSSIPWAFKKPVRPEIPPGAHPVDALVGTPENAKVLSPAAFLRRLSFDTRGLPPPPSALDDFLSWSDQERVSKIVDYLIDTPAFGEKQGQAWLDAVRFAETNGFETDGDRPHAWRYRDWVIEAMNLDMPYDQFLIAQLAGDLMTPAEFPWVSQEQTRQKALIATGFHRCGPVHLVSGNLDKAQLRNEFLTEATTTISSAMLGLTIHCARCHDHKFDPITQLDYYRLQAFIGRIEPVDSSIASSQETASVMALRGALEARMVPIKKSIAQIDEPARSAALKAKIAKIPAEARKAIETPAAKRTAEEKLLAERFQPAIKVAWDDVLAQLNATQKKTRSDLKAKLIELKRSIPAPPAHAWAVKEGPAVEHHLLKRGQVHSRGEIVSPGFPETIARNMPFQPGQDRIALARWIASPNNPLTARVVVNRIWRQYFGAGLVQPEDDFGARSKAVNQPLLDFLATELIRQQWSTKSIHRLIATSATYRSLHFPNQEVRRRRLTAEEIRDASLEVSGELNNRMGGPGVHITLEPEVLDLIFTEGEPDGLWITPSKKTDEYRRSIYLLAKRNVKVPLLESFDQPDLLNPCGRRPDSTHAPQSLVMWNSPWMRERAAKAAMKAIASSNDSEKQVVALFKAVLNRPPTSHEQKLASAAITAKDGMSDLALALFNSNAFLYLD